MQDWPPFIDTILSYPTTSTEVSSDLQQGVMLHGFATASCESLNQAPQRYLDDEKSCDTISDRWITNPIQTFGLSVEPFRTEDYLVGDIFGIPWWYYTQEENANYYLSLLVLLSCVSHNNINTFICGSILQTTDSFLRVDVWPSDLSKTEFIQSG